MFKPVRLAILLGASVAAGCHPMTVDPTEGETAAPQEKLEVGSSAYAITTPFVDLCGPGTKPFDMTTSQELNSLAFQQMVSAYLTQRPIVSTAAFLLGGVNTNDDIVGWLSLHFYVGGSVVQPAIWNVSVCPAQPVPQSYAIRIFNDPTGGSAGMKSSERWSIGVLRFDGATCTTVSNAHRRPNGANKWEVVTNLSNLQSATACSMPAGSSATGSGILGVNAKENGNSWEMRVEAATALSGSFTATSAMQDPVQYSKSINFTAASGSVSLFTHTFQVNKCRGAVGGCFAKDSAGNRFTTQQAKDLADETVAAENGKYFGEHYLTEANATRLLQIGTDLYRHHLYGVLHTGTRTIPANFPDWANVSDIATYATSTTSAATTYATHLNQQ